MLIIVHTYYLLTVRFLQPILCECGQVILEWSKTASFMWMYNEGVYLYRIIKSRVLRINSINLRMYIFGWGVPALMTSIWLSITIIYYKKSSSVCWWGYNLLPYFWILEGPRIIIIIVRLYLINRFQQNYSFYSLFYSR